MKNLLIKWQLGSAPQQTRSPHSQHLQLRFSAALGSYTTWQRCHQAVSLYCRLSSECLMCSWITTKKSSLAWINEESDLEKESNSSANKDTLILPNFSNSSLLVLIIFPFKMDVISYLKHTRLKKKESKNNRKIPYERLMDMTHTLQTGGLTPLWPPFSLAKP